MALVAENQLKYYSTPFTMQQQQCNSREQNSVS